MTQTIQAIETEYNGVLFRSRLEARWAMFLNLVGIEWEYEPEGYDLGHLRYLPDFRIVYSNWRSCIDGGPYRREAFFEVKRAGLGAGHPELQEAIDRAYALSEQSGCPVFIAIGQPSDADLGCIYRGAGSNWEFCGSQSSGFWLRESAEGTHWVSPDVLGHMGAVKRHRFWNPQAQGRNA